MTIVIVVIVIITLILNEESKSSKKTQNYNKQRNITHNTTFVDKIVDAVEQSKTDYDKKVKKEMDLIIDDGFKKDSENIVDALMDSLDKIIPRDVLLSRLTQEWFMGNYIQKCYRCYYIGFCFPYHLPVECPSEVENSYMKTWNEMADYRKRVHSKIYSDYSFLGEEKANAIADLFSDAMAEHNTVGIYLGGQYPLYEIRQG